MIKVPATDKIANLIIKEFQHKHLLGDLALMEFVVCANLQTENRQRLNLIVVGASGQRKSAVMDDIKLCLDKNIFLIDSRFTPYGISNMKNKDRLNNRTWLINDMVRTFNTLSPTKKHELISWLAELMSEAKAGSTTAKEAHLDCRMNMVGNIPTVNYSTIKDFFDESTFNERVIQMFVDTKKDDVRKLGHEEYQINKTLKLNFIKKKIEIPKELNQKIFNLSDDISKLQYYEKESTRPDAIVKAFLIGYAHLNGRTKVKESDLDVLRQFKPYLERKL